MNEAVVMRGSIIAAACTLTTHYHALTLYLFVPLPVNSRICFARTYTSTDAGLAACSLAHRVTYGPEYL